MKSEDRALIGLCAAMLGTGFVIGRKNKKKTAMKQWERQTDVIHLQRELLEFTLHAKRKNPNITYAEWRDGINERLDFLNIISKA